MYTYKNGIKIQYNPNINSYDSEDQNNYESNNQNSKCPIGILISLGILALLIMIYLIYLFIRDRKHTK